LLIKNFKIRKNSGNFVDVLQRLFESLPTQKMSSSDNNTHTELRELVEDKFDFRDTNQEISALLRDTEVEIIDQIATSLCDDIRRNTKDYLSPFSNIYSLNNGDYKFGENYNHLYHYNCYPIEGWLEKNGCSVMMIKYYDTANNNGPKRLRFMNVLNNRESRKKVIQKMKQK
jgi:hypothetical protein